MKIQVWCNVISKESFITKKFINIPLKLNLPLISPNWRAFHLQNKNTLIFVLWYHENTM